MLSPERESQVTFEEMTGMRRRSAEPKGNRRVVHLLGVSAEPEMGIAGHAEVHLVLSMTQVNARMNSLLSPSGIAEFLTFVGVIVKSKF